MYSKLAEEEDKKMTESWKKDADRTIIFVRPKETSCCAIFTEAK
jgi:hypothetical protein